VSEYTDLRYSVSEIQLTSTDALKNIKGKYLTVENFWTIILKIYTNFKSLNSAYIYTVKCLVADVHNGCAMVQAAGHWLLTT
jgi:hypothetical protein